MSDSYTDRLSDFLDDELPVAERREIEEHLAGCEECSLVLRDLDRIRGLAASLPPREPEADLWEGIAAAITPSQAGLPGGPAPDHSVLELRPRETGQGRGRGWRRGIVLTLPQLAAAAVVLLLVGGSAVGVWLRAGGQQATAGPHPEAVASPAPAEGATRLTSLPSRESAADLDRAISDLEAALSRRRGEVDPKTLEVLDHNLAVIDTAIVQIRQALRSEPSSPYLNHSLTDAMWRKLNVLRVATRAAGVSG